jgi:hypothetical protein
VSPRHVGRIVQQAKRETSAQSPPAEKEILTQTDRDQLPWLVSQGRTNRFSTEVLDTAIAGRALEPGVASQLRAFLAR